MVKEMRCSEKGDAINGLLKSPIVSGFDEEGSDKFFIAANSTEDYNVIFIGDFAGKLRKLTRNLPSIEIKVIND